MMIQTQETKLYTPQEYLELEIHSEERYEYINGEIIPMTGGTPNHNKVALNFASALNLGLKRQPLDIFMTDQRIWIPAKRIYTYPDVMVIAQPIEYVENRKDTLINPLLIAEVLSKSTQSYDKDEKFAAYRTISSFQEYLLIDQYKIHLEHYLKTEPRQWLFTEYDNPQDIIYLSSINFKFELADLYDKVDFSVTEE
ncbi:Uma2 family endonuclease [Crocosphaera sp. XPORK-15E]|uniref:Uma2 family endonuclease n=1 Tax=Crocosphaera sp. XPORK-15E TaxID=3110247 RepID=UPI002B21FA55|nr:Uma2 family endonuclease [Crocosphaera sp. XPORK-15E]MEA5535867.1 Uma2 family endonuclease [Crocosphaera sp. XPORK-15E]